MFAMKRQSLLLPATLVLALLVSAPAQAEIHQMPSQSGQSAFAAIQEIAGILEADPATDWGNVNVEGLRQHLIDMDNVTLHAQVKREPTPGGMKFIVSGDGLVKESVQQMIMAHAATMNGVGVWAFTGTETNSGAILTVAVPAADTERLAGLGFIGVMAEGMHHQTHHLMIARGDAHIHK